MKIAILGGTGNIGKGFALRWGQKHEIIIGSREQDKAKAVASEYNEILEKYGHKTSITGTDNKTAAEKAEIIVVAIRYNQLAPVMDLIRPVIENKIVISVVVPMERNMCYISPGSSYPRAPIESKDFNTEYFCFSMPELGSAAQEIFTMIPDNTELVAAFHTVPARKLANLDMELDYDIGVCGNSMHAKEIVFGLVNDISNMRPLDIGPLETAGMIESLTPLLINVAARNEMKDVSLKFI
ncbi:MAG: 8-hydroxy-5-deazaflavin:NADPH oxidoreductase [Methanolobus sp.]|jgi:predicted dinucleotide-binding enzyme|uniref:Putative dinucleotide-binding enzyme n=1 Tax=Methanolobus tindarius DSM 2278 TaxID=1090322 RepID=W9DYE6_METTI|nr:NAD(P)-binding domain-containing protein [Methanolobus tindarius]ETA68421.1 putative dinucleotide-binding enzyme [Methanolobus tindarius DSM 2278]MDI3485608.1 8-hydroxy-5-deazaflavin:NADPH oxidoreductase [Methanolobus sp.]MDK2939496.1 8-hydroxy-5-deazaflavin:NADPH oxidoreductase [Methanolobus sp.]